jgi:PKD repeat protein
MHGTITVTGGPPPPDTPTASFTANPSNPTTGQAVTFDGSTSKDVDGDTIATYKWTFGDGATATTSGPTTTHSYATAGTVTATLVVIDSRGVSSAMASSTVPVAATAGGGGGGGGGRGNNTAPTLSKAHLGTAKLCAKRSPSCKRTSVLIRFRLSAAGKVGLVVKRGHKAVRHGTVNGKAGRNSLSISSTGLKPGRYVLVLTPAGGSAVQLQFTVLAG